MRLSDEICTGLQLANFYQDVVTDWVDRGRRYLPADAMRRFGVTDEQIAARRFDANFRAMMEFLVADARARLERGAKITTLVERDLAATLELFVKGGCAILDAIAAQDYNTLKSRPVVTKAVKFRLLARCGGGTRECGGAAEEGARQAGTGCMKAARKQERPLSELELAYAACREIAQARGEEFLLGVSRAAAAQVGCDVCGVCVHAQGG